MLVDFLVNFILSLCCSVTETLDLTFRVGALSGKSIAFTLSKL